MTLLKQETLFSVIDAAIAAGLECEALLLGIPRDAQASLVRSAARSPREQYLSVFSQLNDWRARGREEPPLRTLVYNMHFLVGRREQAQVFQNALVEIDGAPSKVSDHGELLFTRTKDCYVERGYRVVPPVDAPLSLTFQAWRGTGAVSIIGVAAVAPLEQVIAAVKRVMAQLPAQERVEGCVVLFTDEPTDAEQVHREGLTAIPYKELARMGVREITAFVDRQQAALAQEGAASGPGDENKTVSREIRAGLRESSVRVLVVKTASVRETARRIVLSLTNESRDPTRAAPLLLNLSPQPCDFQALVARAFHEHRVPFSRFDFPGLLAEKAFLPVFAVDSLQAVLRSGAGGDAVLQVLEKGAKVVLVTAEERPELPKELARRFRIKSPNIRTLAVQTRGTKGPIPDPPGAVIPQGSSPSSSFDRGRALLVGVANYPRINRLPENVLSDARDIGELLRSPTRCGYPASNVELLLDGQATAERFRRGLQRLAKQACPEDTVVVYFSGHGFLRQTGTDSEAYLLPFDANLDQLERTALSASELTRLLAAIRASRLLVLLDACHAAGTAYVKTANAGATFKSGLDERTYEVLGRGAGRVVMASSRANETSLILPGMRNSLFTTYLLEALSGAASKQGDDVVRVLDVFHHISENVSRQRASQHPILKAQDVENNFPIALNLQAKRASLGALVSPPVLDPSPSNTSPDERPRPPLSSKARLAIKNRLLQRWDDLADYFGIPLSDKAKFTQGHEGQRTLEWLEERGRLDKLREAFVYLNWGDLVAELDRHSG
ncbi:MAG TPA: caspase family protein [Polyangiaceae bacterium]|nr:caspase family protein [Polyangiaceae bacterium]